MIRKIISGGQTGVETAALDVAIKLGVPHGGWTSRGRRNDDGPLAEIYNLKETSALGFREAIEKNVLESDGTLIVSRGIQTSGAAKAVRAALKKQRQLLHVDLNQYSLFEAGSLTCSWLSQKQIKSVYVTGPTAEEEPHIYEQGRKLLETAFYLDAVKAGGQAPLYTNHGAAAEHTCDWPGTVAEAVSRLKSVLSLKDRSIMANMVPNELSHLKSGLSEYIKRDFGLYANNDSLMKSCADCGGLIRPLPDEACGVILRALYEDLRKTHKLRVIK